MGEANFYYFTCLKFLVKKRLLNMGISQAKWHKKRKTGGKRPTYKKKRKYELGRPASMTKIGGYRVHLVRVRGGNIKRRALRLDTGNFSWGSEAIARKARIIDTVYNAIISIDAAPFRQWHEAHYATPLGRKKGVKLTEADEALFNKKRSKKTQKKYDDRKKTAKVDPLLEEQFQTGRILAAISSRPGQVGRADGYILEGKELEFYIRKLKAKKGK